MKNNIKLKIASGLLLIIIGIGLLLSNYISDKREEVFSAMNLELSIPEETIKEEPKEEEQKKEENNNEEENNSNEEKPQEEVYYEPYIGILEIPKIGFNKGFYSKASSLNNVKFNLKILAVSAYPDEPKGNVIIIGHSGNYSNSYFANLYQLVRGDTATITYNNRRYTYQINNIYTDTKDGTVTIYRDKTQNTLTLITCTKDDETTQTIYIMNLIKVE